MLGLASARHWCETVCGWARERGFASITLTTFRHLAWNAPFYARNGFVCLGDEELTPGLRQRLRTETGLGFDPKNELLCDLS